MSVAHIPSAEDGGGASTAGLADGSAGAASLQGGTFWTDADRASVSKYLASADQMAGFAGVVWKVCLGLIVLILGAWFLGLLPVAVRLI